MKEKILMLFLVLSFPLVVLGQNRDNRLTPYADVTFKKGTIYYLINPDVSAQIEPLSYPLSYKTSYMHNITSSKAYFSDSDKLIEYLRSVSIDKADQKDIFLFLRATALHKIWTQIGYMKATIELDTRVQSLLENDNEDIASFSREVTKIK